MKRKREAEEEFAKFVSTSLTSIKYRLICVVCQEIPTAPVRLTCGHVLCLHCWIPVLSSLVVLSTTNYHVNPMMTVAVASSHGDVICMPQCPMCKAKIPSLCGTLGCEKPCPEYLELQALFVSMTQQRLKSSKLDLDAKEQAEQDLEALKNDRKDALEWIKSDDFKFLCPFSGRFTEKTAETKTIVVEEKTYDVPSHNECFIQGPLPLRWNTFLTHIKDHLPSCNGLEKCKRCERVVRVCNMQKHLDKHKKLNRFNSELDSLSLMCEQDRLANPLLANLEVLTQLLQLLKLVIFKPLMPEGKVADPSINEALLDLESVLKKWPVFNSIWPSLQLDTVLSIQDLRTKNQFAAAVTQFVEENIPLLSAKEKTRKTMKKINHLYGNVESLESDSVAVVTHDAEGGDDVDEDEFMDDDY